MPLGRLHSTELRQWCFDTDQQPFREESAIKILKGLTGGWPLLLEKVVTLVRAGRDSQAIANELSDEAASSATCLELIQRLGMDENGPLVAA